MTTTNKVLYFEGAGMDFEQNNLNQSDVLNHRIRTSFKNNDGIVFYLEMGNVYQRDKKSKVTEKMMCRIDYCFKVKDLEIDDQPYYKHFNFNEFNTKKIELREIDYTKENLTKWINETLNCSFDTIEVINRFYGYHVHGDNGIYNQMEDIELNHKRAAKRSQAYDNAMDYYKNTRKFPCLTVLEMLEDGLSIRCNAYKDELKGLEYEKVFTV